jgi:hypothetical protein
MGYALTAQGSPDIHDSFVYARSRYLSLQTDLVTKFFNECIRPVTNEYTGNIQRTYYCEDICNIFSTYCREILHLREEDIPAPRSFQGRFANLAKANGIEKRREYNRAFYSGLLIDQSVRNNQYRIPNITASILEEMNI